MEQVLLVEGKNDEHVVDELIRQYNIHKNFRIDSCQGLDDLYSVIPITLKSNPAAFGIIIDANSNLKHRWEDLIPKLTALGYSLPDEPDKDGTIIKQASLPALGIWLMPNNQLNGMLEDFMKVLIPENDLLFPDATSIISEIEKKELNKYNPEILHTKALVYTWLAWQKKPGIPLGLAVAKKYFDTNHQLVTQFLTWVKTLFNTK